jgi:hypothetical protein
MNILTTDSSTTWRHRYQEVKPARSWHTKTLIAKPLQPRVNKGLDLALGGALCLRTSAKAIVSGLERRHRAVRRKREGWVIVLGLMQLHAYEFPLHGRGSCCEVTEAERPVFANYIFDSLLDEADGSLNRTVKKLGKDLDQLFDTGEWLHILAHPTEAKLGHTTILFLGADAAAFWERAH